MPTPSLPVARNHALAPLFPHARLLAPDREDRLCGVLLGTALGDALGLPMEGLSRRQIRARFPRPAERFYLLGDTGFVSDDTEQTALLAEAISQGRTDTAAVERLFRDALRGWFLRLPFGIGMATLKACARLCLGYRNSGESSAGNGAAMRSAVIGAYYCYDSTHRRQLSAALARVTHTDRRAVETAVFVAELAALCVRAHADADRCALVRQALRMVTDSELIAAAERACAFAQTTCDLARVERALGASGYCPHTLGWVVYCFIAGETPLEAVQLAVKAGGDTDTHAAIVGACSYGLYGASALPHELIAKLDDGPFGPTHLRGLASALAQGNPAPRWSRLRALARNLALYPVVLAHGFARLWRGTGAMEPSCRSAV